MSKLLIGLLSFTIFLAACEDPAANKPKATTAEPTGNSAANAANNSATAMAPAATGNEMAITPENSKIVFTGSKVNGKHEGGFNKFSGAIDLVDGKADGSSVWVDIDMTSVFTDADGLTKHLMTGDFFDVAKYPKASFRSTRIAADTANGANNYSIIGDLELRGVKKSVTFPATINVTDNNVAVNADFSINRKNFGIVYAGKADDLIRDDVVINLELNAPRKK